MTLVQTVLGPRDASEFDVVSPHEHLLADSSIWYDKNGPATSPLSSLDNLKLADVSLATRELCLLSARDDRTYLVVETTSVGMRPDKSGLATVSKLVGDRVAIVAGCGWYVDRAVPNEWRLTSTDRLVDHLLAEIAGGRSSVPSGVIGEIGTSSPLTPTEVRFLEAAAIAQQTTGLAVQVHLDGSGREGHRVLDILIGAGADPSRVYLSHLDDTLDVGYCVDLISSGCYIGLDAFGADWEIPGQHVASDDQRLDVVESLCGAGFERQVLVAQDTWLRQSWATAGGKGYSHLPGRVVPALVERGLRADLITRANPLRWLTGKDCDNRTENNR